MMGKWLTKSWSLKIFKVGREGRLYKVVAEARCAHVFASFCYSQLRLRMVFCSSISDMNALLLCVAYVLSTFSVHAEKWPEDTDTEGGLDHGSDPEPNPDRIGQSCPDQIDLVDSIIPCYSAF